MPHNRVHAFIEKISPLAREIETQYGIPYAIVISQAALETGWGEHVYFNNYFNITASSDYKGEKEFRRDRYWRVYSSMEESFHDYARVLRSDRYKSCFNYLHDPDSFARELQNNGYVGIPPEDPDYAANLISIMNKWDLKPPASDQESIVRQHIDQVISEEEKRGTPTVDDDGIPYDAGVYSYTPLNKDKLSEEQVGSDNFEFVELIRVIDGDTIVVRSEIMSDTNEDSEGTHVRLVGINAPELAKTKQVDDQVIQLPNEVGAVESREFLRSLLTSSFVENRILIEWGISEAHKFDQYGRPLAVVYLVHNDGSYVNVNTTMLTNRHAQHFPFKGDPSDLGPGAVVLSRFNEHDLSSWERFVGRRPEELTPDFEGMIQKLAPIGDNYDNRDVILGPLSDYSLRIGDTQFTVPPLSISVIRQSLAERVPIMRNKGSFMKKNGQMDTMVEIDLFFSGVEEINGRRVDFEKIIIDPDTPDSDYRDVPLDHPYYVNGLRSLIAQFRKTPFLPVENKTLNDQFGIYAVGLVALTASTLSGFPNCLRVSLKLVHFDINAFIPDALLFSDEIIWPLFRWYYQQSMQRHNTSLQTYLAPVLGESLTDTFRFGYVPTNLEGEINYKYIEQGDYDVSKNQASALATYYLIKSIEDQQRMPETEFQKKAWDMGVLREAIIQMQEGTKSDSKSLQLEKGRFYYKNGIGRWYNRIKENDPVFVLPLKSNEIRHFGYRFYGSGNDSRLPGYEYCLKNEVYVIGMQHLDLLLKMNEEWTRLVQGYIDQIYLTEEDLPIFEYSIPGLTLQSVRIGLENTITTLHSENKLFPIHQYLGAQDTVINATFRATSEEAIERLDELWRYSNEVSRNSDPGNGNLLAGMLRFDTELTRLFGVSHVLIERMDIGTIQGQPGVFEISVSMIEFNREQRKALDLAFITGNPDNDPSKLTKFDDEIDKNQLRLLRELNQLPVYPDLELPFQSDLKRFLAKLDIGVGEYHLYGARYVEPDFYMLPSQTEVKHLMNFLNEVGWMEDERAREESYRERVAEEVPIYSSNVPQGIVNRINELEEHIEYYQWQAEYYREKDPWLADSMDRTVLELQAEMYSLIADAEFWSMDDTEEEPLAPVTAPPPLSLMGLPGSESETFLKGLSPMQSGAGYGSNWANFETHESKVIDPNDTPGFSVSRGDTKGFYHDFYTYNKRGRLARAFPAFQLMIMDEGQQIGVRKLFDNLYGVKGIFDINVHRSKHIAADMVTITFSDPFLRFSSHGKIPDSDPPDFARRRLAPTVWGELNITPSLMRERALERFKLNLKEGARIHLRMGYGSNTKTFPVVFNGRITELGIGEIVQIAAQSDAIEIVNTFIEKENTKNWFWDSGVEPQNWIMQTMTERGRRWGEWWKYQSAGFFGDEHQTIRSFGRSNYPASAFRDLRSDLEKEMQDRFKDVRQSYIDDLERQLDELRIAVMSEIDLDRREELQEELNELLDHFDAVAALHMELFTPRSDFTYDSVDMAEFFKAFDNGVSYYDALKALAESRANISQNLVDEMQFWIENANVLDYRATQSGWLPGEIADNIWKANKKMSYTEKGADEVNVRINTIGKSAWDIIQGMAFSVSDYIATVHPFGLRSTLFYGRPHWLFAYDYDEEYINDDTRATAKFIRTLNEMGIKAKHQNLYSEAWRKSHLKYKPYMQIHFYDSFSDLLINNIQATSRNVFTKVHVSANNGSKSWVHKMWADKDIDEKDIRIVPIESDLRIQSVWGSGKDVVSDFGANSLAEYLRNMYQGVITILGDPALKPYDMVGIDDRHSDMKGPCTVRSVTHTMSFDQGFVTSFEPEPCVSTDDGILAQMPVIVSSIIGTMTLATVISIGYKVGPALLGAIAAKIPPQYVQAFWVAVKTNKLTTWLAGLPAFLKTRVFDAISAWAVKVSTGKGFIAGTGKILTKTGAITKAVLGATKAAAATTAGTIIIGALIAAVVLTAGYFMFTSFKGWLRRKFKSEQACVMTLLTWRGEPFKAGISGHSGLVYGDRPPVRHRSFWQFDTWINSDKLAKEWFGQQRYYFDEPIDPNKYSIDFIETYFDEDGQEHERIVDTHYFDTRHALFVNDQAMRNVRNQAYRELDAPQIGNPDLTEHNKTLYEMYRNLCAKMGVEPFPSYGLDGAIHNAYVNSETIYRQIRASKPLGFADGHKYGRALEIYVESGLTNQNWDVYVEIMRGQIELVRMEIHHLMGIYPPGHPDIIAAEEKLERLLEEVRAETARRNDPAFNSTAHIRAWLQAAYDIGFNGIGYNATNQILHVDLMVNDKRANPFYYISPDGYIYSTNTLDKLLRYMAK